MLIGAPFEHTMEDVLFDVRLERQDQIALAHDEVAALRDDYFSTGRACLRASPLTKSHGWGVVFDTEGRAALCASESSKYQHYLKDNSITKLAAMPLTRV